MTKNELSFKESLGLELDSSSVTLLTIAIVRISHVGSQSESKQQHKRGVGTVSHIILVVPGKLTCKP